MILMSTTATWNPGDDLIREGVMRLLDVREPVMWLSRTQIGDETWWTAFHNCVARRPDNIVRHARAFVLAGSPEWVTSLEKVWEECTEERIPILIVGVGGTQRDEEQVVNAAAEAGVILGATVRDGCGTPLLDAVGVSYQRFLDPAFHATSLSYAEDRRHHRIFNPKLETPEQIEFYGRLYERFADVIDLVVVHEPREYQFACGMGFNCPVWFHSDYWLCMEPYGSCRLYIGGRLHGATAAAWRGAEVWLVEYDAKHRVVDTWSRDFDLPDNSHVVSQADAATAIVPTGRTAFTRAQEAIRYDFRRHRAYWSSRFQPEEVKTTKQ